MDTRLKPNAASQIMLSPQSHSSELGLTFGSGYEASPVVKQGAVRASFYRRRGKRILDLALAVASLPFLAPVIFVLAILVGLQGGKPFFRHKRVGAGGYSFNCLKLRTMSVDAAARLKHLLETDPEAAAEWAESQKLTRDPRITRLGLFLRRTSLDELPQIWNVLRGEMSFVGPRPIVTDEISRYGEFAPSYFRATPGITGVWQATARDKVSYDERVQLDVEYEKNITFLRDLHIIALTSRILVRSTGH